MNPSKFLSGVHDLNATSTDIDLLVQSTILKWSAELLLTPICNSHTVEWAGTPLKSTPNVLPKSPVAESYNKDVHAKLRNILWQISIITEWDHHVYGQADILYGATIPIYNRGLACRSKK